VSEGPVVTMEGIGKEFPGVVALSDVDLSLNRGEILGLIGANGAGKSTLVNILAGVVTADAGRMTIDGETVVLRNPREAQLRGIAFVQQEIATFASMSVADNLFLTGFPTAKGLIDRKEVQRLANGILTRLGCAFGPDDAVETLSTGDRQMVTIARAMLADPKVLILDEPTSSLSATEKERFFEVVRALSKDGVSVIFISHFLDEVFTICDRVTVMRNGRHAGSGDTSTVTMDDVIQWMIGSSAKAEPVLRSGNPPGDVVLEVRDLTRHGLLEGVSLSARRGEIIGVWGLMGSGRTELVRAIVGLDPIDSGEVLVNLRSKLVSLRGSRRQRHIGYVPEDRRQEGLFLPMSVQRNISMSSLRSVTTLGFVRSTREARVADTFIERFGIKVSGRSQRVSTLSGGNQQKVVISRWVALAPPVYILDEPMRGLDIGAKAQIRDLIVELADQGIAVIVIDSELQELQLVADRYVIMRRGRVVAERGKGTSDTELMSLAAGVTVST
jgi:ABC-type sugar transport system ATPase subunit